MRAAAIVLLGLAVACSDSGPNPSIAFRPDAATCVGSAVVDLYIDGSKVGSPELTIGVASDGYPVSAGSHVVSATSQASGSVWASEQINVDAPTVYVLTCTASRRLVPFVGTLVNALEDPIIITSGGDADTIAARVSVDVPFVGTGGFVWSPVPVRYGDGSVMPDDQLVGSAHLIDGGTTTLTAEDDLGQPYFTFTVANNTGVPLSIGEYSGVSLRCLANLPASGTFNFGYFYLRNGVEVRVYDGANCTGTSAHWDFAVLSTRDPNSGYIPLTVNTPP